MNAEHFQEHAPPQWIRAENVASLAHELRTPLTAILGFTDVLLAGMAGDLTAKQRTYLDDVRASGKVLLGIITDFLDLSAIAAGRLRCELADVDGLPVLEHVASLARGLADARGQSLVVTSGLKHASVRVDEGRLHQILLNLTMNAIKFTPRGGSIRLVADELSDGRIRFEVIDNGPGIAREDLERIFEPFGRGETPDKWRTRGWGLGLALSRALAELQGGRLELRSVVGAGTQACLTFSRTPAAGSKNWR